LLAALSVRGFRNLEPLEVELSGGTHLLLGDNGAGKTSVLEAVYLLSTTRSFRTAQIKDCVRHGEQSFSLRGEVEGERRVRLDVAWEGGNRTRAVNGGATSLAEHLGVLPLVCWSSGDLEILLGPPAERRRFIDRGVVSLRPGSIADLTRYRRALAEKRQLLIKGGGELAAWNGVLADAAARLIRLRADLVSRLEGALEEVLGICEFGFPPIRLRYRPSPAIGLEGVEAIYGALEEAEKKERHRERPLIGPHRDDLLIQWDCHGIRRVASAGERKALGLALHAALGHLFEAAGREPVYLLDDADTELDVHRMKALWRLFGGATQLIATSNRPQIWHDLGIDRRWRLTKGVLESI
jgi:DNA replication and repair protein RecF